MGAKNEKDDIDDKAMQQAKTRWEQSGKTWETNPPLASHFGGVWERAIGQIRQVIDGYLLPKDNRLLDREEFMTMLLHAARIVNSTPLWDPPDSPNEPEPITPQRLLTQRDDACNASDSITPKYTEADLRGYGANRSQRIEALVDKFWEDWKQYIYMS